MLLQALQLLLLQSDLNQLARRIESRFRHFGINVSRPLFARDPVIEQLPEEARYRLFERVIATTIANKTILRCLVVGLPLTADNVIGLVDDFVDDPQTPAVQDLMIEILQSVEEFVELWERTASLRQR